MRMNFKTVQMIAALVLATACVKMPEKEKVDVSVDLPDFKVLMDSIMTCQKSESDISISDLAAQHSIVLEDKIDSQEQEITDCEGKVTKVDGPIKQLNRGLSIEAPEKFKSDVLSIKIENDRTCTIHQFDTKDEELTEESSQSPMSAANRAGDMSLKVTDGKMKLNLAVNVTDGKNVLKITYYGRCLKYRPENDTPTLKTETFRCLDAEVLGQKEVLLDVQIERKKIDGILKVDSCTKKRRNRGNESATAP